MKAAGLVGVLVLAKALAVWDLTLPASVWLPSVLFWDDVAVGVGFWAVDRAFGRLKLSHALYWALVTWAVVNVPIARALASPLTSNMLGAARGALLDSITHYLTLGTASVIAALFFLAAFLPRWLARVSPGVLTVVAAATVVVALPGPFLARRVDLQGRERNAVTAMVRTLLPRVESRTLDADWRASPSPSERSEDLAAWRSSAQGRNVIMIVLESTAARYLRSYGAADDPTPNLSALASQAIQFDRAYAVYPESIKGLFAAMCSRAPAFDVGAEAHAEAPCASLARALSAAGYRTALFHSGRFGYLGMDAVVARQGFDTLEDAGAIGGRIESSFGVDETSTVERMLSWVDAHKDTRFFITYLPTAGHHPYATAEPGPFSGRGDFSAYQNALYEGDRSLGALVAGLQTRGLDRHTLFVIFGDHGEAFGQHGGNLGHTFQIFDENVRVPLLFVIPGVTTTHRSVANVASVVDIAPTVLDLVGLPIPPSYEGSSLLAPGARMALFYTDYSIGLLGLQDDCFKYQLDIETPRSRLFNTCVDPDETLDLAAAQPERVRAYGDRLKGWSSATRDRILSRR